MITSVAIENFRSIERMTLDLGKINVLTGANNSGKSSLIYALLVLKNAVTNPNQTLDSIFNFDFINLGPFKENIYKKQDDKRKIRIEIRVSNKKNEVNYGLEIGKTSSSFFLKNNLHQLDFKVDVAFPIATLPLLRLMLKPEMTEQLGTWNGITGKGVGPSINWVLNAPTAHIVRIDVLPVRRAFSQPYYHQVPLRKILSKEEEIATLLAIDRDLTGQVAHYLDKIVDKVFSIHQSNVPGLFHLQTRDKQTGFTADLVNEGLGTNQLVTILAKALYKNASFICIDEPEIHLHPSIIDKLVNVLIDIANERNKQFLISTHSEHFINALLSAVIKRRITPDEVKVYHLTKEGWDTKAEQQKINEHGQISGGLSHFYAVELESWKTFFKITD